MYIVEFCWMVLLYRFNSKLKLFNDLKMYFEINFRISIDTLFKLSTLISPQLDASLLGGRLF